MMPVERGGLKSEGGRDSWEHFHECAGKGLHFGAHLDPDKRMLTCVGLGGPWATDREKEHLICVNV